MIRKFGTARFALCLSALITVASAGWGTQAFAASISVTDAQAESNGETIGVGLTIINNGSAEDQLFAVKSPIAKAARLFNPHAGEIEGADHASESKDAVMSLLIEPGASVELNEDGQHIMLMELNQQIASGATFPVTLFFKKGGRVTVDVTVE